MSGAYLYTPTTPRKYAPQLHPSSPYYPSPRAGTPVIPAIPDTLYPPSPYSDHDSPNRSGIPLPEDPTTPNQFEFPSLSPYGPAYDNPWGGAQRERRPSWQGVDNAILWPQAAMLYPDSGGGVYRRHSFGAIGYRPPYLEAGGMSPNTLFTPLFIHPWIDAESPAPEFYFDLSLSTFEPMQVSENGQSNVLPDDLGMHPATRPPTSRLRILISELREWPCDIHLDPYQEAPITFMDVLGHVHRHLHTAVSQEEYDLLTHQGKVDVAAAYTKRCRAIPNNFVDERAKGIRRVDYLYGKTRMVGLKIVGRDGGWDVAKLIVA
ncbi:hypothetical protein DXG01_002952 [Tephrocybe rancida]|nr:hypothetical protein DXG01_002952 [Tephrocybe rancida]